MNAQILEKLTASRDKVMARYEQMVNQVRFDNQYGCNKSVIESKAFFGKVVMEYFESMSKITVNKCLKDNFQFSRQLSLACDKAVYACNKPTRDMARAIFAAR
jgi:uncharacterized protein YktA (UPF0223 family)